MTWYGNKEEALKALHAFFGKTPTIYDVIAMDRTPKQTQALCAALLGEPYPKGVSIGFLRRAVASVIKDAEPRDRQRASVVVAQAEQEAASKLRKARAAADKILLEAEGLAESAWKKARKKGEEDADLLTSQARVTGFAIMRNIDAAIAQLNARIREAEAAGVETGLKESHAVYSADRVWSAK